MYKDHIVKTRMTDSAVFMGAVAVVIFIITLACGVGEGRLSHLMGPIVLDLRHHWHEILQWAARSP
jgi:polar amino acid transport system permease protein